MESASVLSKVEPMSRGDDSEFSLPARTRCDPGVVLGSPVADALLAKIESGKVRIGIIGLGYVGLPLARAFSRPAIAVLGFDVDPAKIARLERGESYIGHISDARRPPDARLGQFEATVDFGRLDEPDVVDHLRADAADRGARAGFDASSSVPARAHRRRACGRASSSFSKARPTRAPPATWCCRSWQASGLKAGRRFLPGLQPRA